MKAFQVKQSILTKRHLTGPRIVFVPLAGPVSFKVAATQALSDVVQRYAKDHPEKSEKVSLDMREARNDLAAFFKEHPDLQKQAQDDFKDRVNQLFHSPKTIDWDGEDEILNDWAHINPTDD
ncbi:hypothetical protein KEM48_009442 [Puccinia striiformis f. sp. tritici PST-130]|nr:hypothetical protein KEM48_009442 [Puccinia striiformis f. sp. tritici PST-130]